MRKNASGKKDQVFKLWMDRFDDLVIENDKMLSIKIEYIHNNSVKAGYVDEPEEWEFSSARNYTQEDHRLLMISTDWEKLSPEQNRRQEVTPDATNII